jgi:toxin ParE1/3/4
VRDLVKDRVAEEDLIGIYVYSVEVHGERQAKSYLDEIEAGIRRLIREPSRGRDRSSLRPGYWSVRVRHHVIFYVFDDAHVRIRRVLHERMDADRHLSEE